MQGKRIVLGVTGGIAAFKAASICSMLSQRGADVRVIMTQAATQFVTKMTFQALSRNDVYSDVFDEHDPDVIAHIDLADHTDLFIIAPATANTIAKLAYGLADDMLTSTMLATRAPVIIAPAMNVHMYEHPTVLQNMATLQQRGYHVVEPGEGQLACGYVGKGRMAEPEAIITSAHGILSQKQDLHGLRVLVTGGPTVEAIDPVRYLTNRSSGRMGFAIADAAAKRGAEVTLISGPTNLATPANVTQIKVTSTADMYKEVMRRYRDQDVVIKAAAVSDYRPVAYDAQKIKKQAERLTLQLVRTPDILSELGKQKNGQFLVGFAAETDAVEQHALDKLKRKNLDLIVANDVTTPGAGFDVDTNIVSLYNREGLVKKLPKMTKRDVANELLDTIKDQRHE